MRVDLTLLGALVLAAILPSAAAQAGSDPIASSIVKITTVQSTPNLVAPWQRRSPEAVVGSGVVIGDRRILTNAHVVADHVDVEVQRGGVGRRYGAEVQYLCDVCDLAILSVEDDRFFEGAKPVRIGDLPEARQPVRVYGFPKGGRGLSVTEGVVSRIGVDRYAHSASSMLTVQVDAAINPGNSGGPVISEGRIIGISMQSLKDAENIAYLVPAPVISHFLADVKDGSFDGFPDLGVYVQTLENQALRKRLGLSEGSGGVLVTSVARRGSAHGRIRPGDVILAIDGVPVQEDNTVELEGLHLSASVVVQRAQVGEEISIDLVRDGREVSQTVPMSVSEPLVRLGDFNRSPEFRIFGGLVFQPLTVRYLDVFGTAPDQLARYWVDPYYADHEILGIDRPAERRREVVVLTGLLANELTRGYEPLEDGVVKTVNDQPVRDLQHLSSLLDDAHTEFVTIVMESGDIIVLDRARTEEATARVLSRYQVSVDRSDGLVAYPASQESEQE